MKVFGIMEDKVLKLLEFDKLRQMLMQNAVTATGKEAALALLPVNNIDDVKNMLTETDHAVWVIEKNGSSPISGFNDIRSVLRRIRVKAILSMTELIDVAQFLKAVRLAQKAISECNSKDENNIFELSRLLVPMRDIEEEIFNDIIGEGEMADSASSRLSSIRRQIRQQNDSIKDRLNSLIRSLDRDGILQEGIVTMRNNRYVLPVIAAHKGRVPGIVHDQSQSGLTLFIEPMVVVEINNTIQQLKLDERDEIQRILEDFSKKLSDNYSALESNHELLTQLDIIFAKAKLSREMDGIRPKINSNKFIKIVDGKHPLIDKKNVVPINIWLGKEFTQLLITGPNTGGKTVSLKTVGLFALMTQSGMHIPASVGSEMPVFDNIYADIGDEQSIQQNLSTFSSHMKNIAEIMSVVTEDSLVLFDELGAGTDPTEGAALAMAILEELRKRRIRTVVTSHYAELKAYSLTHAGAENASVEFDVVSLKPTYHLMVGVPGNSNAFLISEKLGLPRFLIDRARSYVDEDSRKLNKVLTNAEEYRISAQTKSTEAQMLKQEIIRERKQLEKEKAELLRDKEKIIASANREAEKIKSNASAEAEKIIEQLKEITKNADASALFKAREVKKKLNEEKPAEMQLPEADVPIKEFLPGMDVYVTSVDKEGVLLKTPNAKGKATVQVGIIQMEVDVKYLAESKNKGKNEQAVNVKVHRAHSNVPLSLDVRGQMSDEAVINVDMYLDLAFGRNLGSVNVIHGKGTGALKNAIWDYLKNNKRVKSFRLGAYGEGDAGVTIIELKN